MPLYVGPNQFNGALAVSADQGGNDATPNQFSFTDVSGVEPGTVSRGQVSLDGVDAGATLTAVNGRLSNNSGLTWATSVSFIAGATLLESNEVTAGAPGSVLSAPLTTVNGISDTYTVTSRAADVTPPVITLAGGSVTITEGQVYTDAGATALDNVDGDVTDRIVVNNPVDTSTPGSYSVTYDVSDSSGNAAAQVSRTVLVVALSDVPNPVSLASFSDADPDTAYTRSANITGVDTGVTLNATGALELSNDGVNWLTTLVASATSQLRVTVTTGAEAGQAYTASGTVNGVSVSLTATTAVQYQRSGRHMVYSG